MLPASLLAATVLAFAPTSTPSNVQEFSSPNGRIDVTVSAGERLTYDVSHDGKPLLAGAALSLDVDHVKLGIAPQFVRVVRSSVDRRISPAVKLEAASLPEKYNELRVECAGGYAVVFRAYDEGVGYRFETALPAAEVKVYGEEAVFAFAQEGAVYFPHESGFFSHNEEFFRRRLLREIPASQLGSLPAVVETAAGPKVAIAESDLEDYAGLWLRGTGGAALSAAFPPYPLEEKATRDRDVKVVRAADYIAITKGTRTFPWRVLGIAATDAELITNPLVYLLQRPSEIADTSWIRPGRVAWDWWNDRNLQGVSFKPGMNTQTYKHFIDFASRFGIEYVVLDEGWYKFGDVLSVVPELDMAELLAYARGKKVGIILWVVWKTLADQLQPALALYESWGVKGLKIDFMQRDDQPVINFYTHVTRELAKRKMLADYHGGQKPALMTRTWPNIVSTEGVKGMEHLKWSNASDPEHNVTLPFTRMFLGPMDYTPGAMLNASRDKFKIVFKRPMSLGTRCHQLAMYVVYESPLQMLADSPTNYAAQPESMEFLSWVPTVWDETRVLDARMGDYVVVARRDPRGGQWWIGAMTDWTGRELDLDLSFLGYGKWQLTAFEDGPTAATVATDYRKTTRPVDRTTRLKIRLAPGGGWAARITATK